MARATSRTVSGKLPDATASKSGRGTGAGATDSAAPNKVEPASVASLLPKMGAVRKKAAQTKFVQGVLHRGEAVPAGKPMPPGATHEITGKREDGTAAIKRKRFSLT